MNIRKESSSSVANTDGVYERDYSPVLGLSLSVVLGRIATKCHIGKAFQPRDCATLRINLERMLEDVATNQSKQLKSAFDHLSKGLSILMGFQTISASSMSLVLHEYFYSAFHCALHVEKNSCLLITQSAQPSELLHQYEMFLLACKVQVICTFFRRLDQQYRIQHEYPTDDFSKTNSKDVVDKIMKTVRFVTKSHLDLNYKSRKQNNRRYWGFKQAEVTVSTLKVERIPSWISNIFVNALSIDRIVESHERGLNKSARYNDIFNTKQHISIFQQEVANEVGMPIALIPERADKNLVTRTAKPAKMFTLLSESTNETLGMVELSSCSVSYFGSSKGILMVSYGISSNFELYDVKSARLLRTFENASKVVSFVIDSASDRVFTGDVEGCLKEWSLLDYNMNLDLSCQIKFKSEISCLSTDEGPHNTKPKFLLSGHKNGTITVWNILSNKTSLMFSIYTGTRGTITMLVCANAELFSSGDDNIVKIWDIKQKKCVHSIPHGDTVASLAIDNDVVFTATGRYLNVYERCNYVKIEVIEQPEIIFSLHMDTERHLYTFGTSVRKWNVDALVDSILKRDASFATEKRKESSEGEMTISEILANPRIRGRFMLFLKESYADENLLFWIAVQRYRDFYEHGTSKSGLSQLGTQIVEEYIYSDAPLALNVSDEVRENLTSLHEQQFSKDTFAETEKEVLKLLDGFVYRFKSSVLSGYKDNY